MGLDMARMSSCSRGLGRTRGMRRRQTMGSHGAVRRIYIQPLPRLRRLRTCLLGRMWAEWRSSVTRRSRIESPRQQRRRWRGGRRLRHLSRPFPTRFLMPRHKSLSATSVSTRSDSEFAERSSFMGKQNVMADFYSIKNVCPVQCTYITYCLFSSMIIMKHSIVSSCSCLPRRPPSRSVAAVVASRLFTIWTPRHRSLSSACYPRPRRAR
jgi:hypothetical protein